MDRRIFIGAAACGLFVVSLAVKAQQVGRVRRIGWLWNDGPQTPAEIQQQTVHLRALGWVEARNLVVERRYTSGNADLLSAFAEDLVQLKVELIVAEGTLATLAAKKATSTIPIVVSRSADPVRAGLVASLARPGANVTGTSTIHPDLSHKRLQILRELLPTARRIGELVVPANPIDRATRNEYERMHSSLGMQPIFVEVAQASDLESAIAEAARRGAQVLHVSPEPLLNGNFPVIMRAARKYSLPIMVDGEDMLLAGGIVMYAPDEDELDRELASFIDRILRGAKPADLPIQQPTKFQLWINLKTANAFGITVPQSLLLRANKVIQ